jgi:glutaredoxin
MFSGLLKRVRAWWQGRSGSVLKGCQVVLYTRQGCHLCEIASQRLQNARRQYGFRMEAVDVDGNPELRAEHGDWVPVVAINGKVRFRGTVNEVLLHRLLRAEAKQARKRQVRD